MKPPLPFVVGGEVAGVVRSAPDGAHVRPGDRVLALTMLGNAMAAVAVTPVETVFHLPDNLSMESRRGHPVQRPDRALLPAHPRATGRG